MGDKKPAVIILQDETAEGGQVNVHQRQVGENTVTVVLDPARAGEDSILYGVVQYPAVEDKALVVKYPAADERTDIGIAGSGGMEIRRISSSDLGDL